MLAERAKELEEAQGLSKTSASLAAAREADPENEESIARNIRRYLSRAKGSTPPGKAPVRAGLGGLLAVLSSRLDLLEKESETLLETGEQFDLAWRRVVQIRSILEARLTELASLTASESREQASALLAGLDGIDAAMDPEAVVEGEVRRLEQLIKRTWDVATKINTSQIKRSRREY